MKTQFTYFIILFASIFFPFFIGFHSSISYNKNWKVLFKAFSITAILFVCWDILFTSLGVWGFNDKYIVGLYFFNLPIEEVLFFYVIPFCCFLIYESLKFLFKLKFETKWISYSLSILSLVIACCFYNRMYTSSTFLLAAFLLFFIAIKKYSFLPYFYLMFLISMIPFLIVNGLLTGTYIDEPVVWYNNIHNSTYRMLTIPLEDIFYGFDLLLINVIIYEKLQEKKN